MVSGPEEEVGGGEDALLTGVEGEGGLVDAIGFGFVELLGGDEAIEDVALPLFEAGPVAVGIEGGGAVGESGEEAGLGGG